MKDSILHATLKKDNVVLLASDMVSHTGLIKGNAVSLMLNCSTEDELKKCFEKLSRGGEQTFPIEVTHWGALFGGLSDKYGNHWLLHYQKQ